MNKKVMLFVLASGFIGCSTIHRPLAVTSNDFKDYRMGTSCESWALAQIDLFSWGRRDVMHAAQQAQITKIAVVDQSSESYLVYGKKCTHVYGL